MRRRTTGPADSLDLLLDTMCNTFGGIILIALLVALLARTGGPSTESSASRALYDQRIAMAEAELEDLRKESDSHSSDQSSTTLADLALAESALAAAREDAVKASTETAARAQDIAKVSGSGWSALARELQELARQEADLRNLIAATEAETARLLEREADLKAQAAEQRAAQTVKLRFPKERAITRTSLPVICQHGRVYPLYTSDRNLDRLNIKWRSMNDDAEESTPISDKGISLPDSHASLRNVLNGMGADAYYVTFYVYPESYDAFRLAKEIAIESRFEFGISVVRKDQKLSWSSRGSSPPPL